MGLEWGSRYGAGLGSLYGAVGSWCGAELGLGVPLWGWGSRYGAGLGVPLWGENLVMGQGLGSRYGAEMGDPQWGWSRGPAMGLKWGPAMGLGVLLWGCGVSAPHLWGADVPPPSQCSTFLPSRR